MVAFIKMAFRVQLCKGEIKKRKKDGDEKCVSVKGIVYLKWDIFVS